jgi:hypothetical protein
MQTSHEVPRHGPTHPGSGFVHINGANGDKQTMNPICNGNTSENHPKKLQFAAYQYLIDQILLQGNSPKVRISLDHHKKYSE